MVCGNQFIFWALSTVLSIHFIEMLWINKEQEIYIIIIFVVLMWDWKIFTRVNLALNGYG